MCQQVVGGNSAINARPDHRTSVSTLKVAAHNFVQPAVAQDQGFQLETLGSEHVNGFLILV